MTKLKLAVIGAGHLGRIHAKLIHGIPDVELVGVADPVADAREQVAADCLTRAFADHRGLIDQIDGAVIATPTSEHHAIGLDFLRRGVGVLIEKPLAPTLSQADDLVSTARRYNAILQVGHIERFNPALSAALPHLVEPKYIEAVRAGSFTFRSTDIGVVLDLMVHDLDVVLHLVGASVRRVQALGLALVGQHEDVAQARLEFETGCVVNLSASRVSAAPARRMQVWTPLSLATIDFQTRTASVVKPSDTLRRHELDVEAISPAETMRLKEGFHHEHLPVEQLAVESRNALADELQDFTNAIRTAGTPRVTGQHGRDVVAIAERILDEIAQHAWHGRADGPVGPLATIGSPILRGPHWDRADATPARREAG